MLVTEPCPAPAPPPSELDAEAITDARDVIFTVGRVCGGPQVKVEGKDVENKDEGDRPFKDGWKAELRIKSMRSVEYLGKTYQPRYSCLHTW